MNVELLESTMAALWILMTRTTFLIICDKVDTCVIMMKTFLLLYTHYIIHYQDISIIYTSASGMAQHF